MNAKTIITILSIIIILSSSLFIGYKIGYAKYTNTNREYQTRVDTITNKYNDLQKQYKELNIITGRQQQELDKLTTNNRQQQLELDKLTITNRRTKELAYEIGKGLEGDEDIIERAINTLSKVTELIQYIIDNQ